MPWAPSIANQENIKAVLFLTCGAATCSFLIHESRHQETEYPVSPLFFPENERKKITQFMHDSANGLTNEERFFQCVERSSSIVLIKTSKEIESKYLEYFSVQVGKEVVPVGPLVQEFEDKEDDDKVFIEWLDKKKNSSVVFVSFGSEYFLSKDEIEEMAYGLELSGVDFIWVLRFHGGEKAKVHEALPQGFLGRVGDKGMVVEAWAPQGKILKHESIGGFVSHCGWSSILEGVKFGVPIVAMPMQLDQPLNAKVVVGVGVGVEVKRENGRFKREEVGRVIKQVVVEDEGKQVRERVKEVRERMIVEGDEEMDLVVEKLVKLILES